MKVVTWNMQGANFSSDDKWQSGVKRFFFNGAMVICLQECGTPPKSAKAIWQSIRYPGLELLTWGSKRSRIYILFHKWDTRSNRVNTAIATKYELDGSDVLAPIEISRTSRLYPNSRPVIGIRIGLVHYYSLHAISPNGPDVRLLMEAVHNAAGGEPVLFVAGDFNQDPRVLKNWQTCAPLGATYSTRAAKPTTRKDYAYSNFASVQGEVIRSLVASDHYPVEYDAP